MSETDEEKLRRHLAEFNAAVAEACDLPDDAPDHIKAMADAIRPPKPQMSDAAAVETAKYLLTQYERELARTSEAYASHMPSQIAAEYRRRRVYATGAVDVLRKVMATADGRTEMLG